MQKPLAGNSNAMFDILKGYKLILASNSPRRKELLMGLGLDFTVQVMHDTDESYPSSLPVALVAEFIALQKAYGCKPHLTPTDLIVTADTVVCVGNQVLGKPKDRKEAIEMLALLSGKSHWVYTGVSLLAQKHQVSFTSKTEVFFSTLTESEMVYYVDTYKPYDKAGAYGVQEWIGFVGVERIEGSYFNVMGLPVHQLYQALRDFPGIC